MNSELEQAQQVPEALEHLREWRHERAEHRRRRDLLAAIPDAIETPSSSFLNIHAGCQAYDTNVGNNELMALSAFDYSPEDVFRKLSSTNEDDVVLEVGEGDECIIAKRYGTSRLTLSWPSQENESMDFSKKPQKLAAHVVERYKKSPAHRALREASLLLKEEGASSHSITTSKFDPTKDILGTNAALSQLGFTSGAYADGLELPSSLSKTWRGITSTINTNPETGEMSFTFTSRPEYSYAEQANQGPGVESIPFVETKCAEELFGSLAAAGLMIHPSYQEEMMRIGEAERFGGVYTQMSREIAKWVDRSDRVRVRNLFCASSKVSDWEAYYADFQNHEYDKTEEEKETEELELRERLLDIDESELSEPTKVLLRLAKQSITRDANTSTFPELPVTRGNVEFTNGTCFDVAGYYLQSVGIGELHIVQEGAVSMFEKTHGGHTYLLLHPTILNDVELPKGTLMQKGRDDNWAMLRLTPFCFDTEEDQRATGSELYKAYENQMRRIQRVGSKVLDAMVHSVQSGV